MKNKIIKSLFISVFLLFATEVAFAVMPSQHYKNLAEMSKIKATAVVLSVNVIESTKYSTYKSVTFQLRKSYSGKDVPEEFSGKCSSVDYPWQKPGAGGEIYFYPQKGHIVYVTVSQDGGSITSYTILTPKLEEALENNKVRFGMGNAYVDE